MPPNRIEVEFAASNPEVIAQAMSKTIRALKPMKQEIMEVQRLFSTAVAKGTPEAMEKYVRAVAAGSPATKAFAKDVDNLAHVSGMSAKQVGEFVKQAERVDTTLAGAGKQANTVSNNLIALGTRFLGVFEVLRQAKEMVNAFTSLEEVQLRLQVQTGMTAKEAKRFTDTMSNAA